MYPQAQRGEWGRRVVWRAPPQTREGRWYTGKRGGEASIQNRGVRNNGLTVYTLVCRPSVCLSGKAKATRQNVCESTKM